MEQPPTTVECLHAHCFNPWRDHDPTTDLHPDAHAQRLARPKRHLACDARFLLIGEAPGHQGAKVSGIPFTSERLGKEAAVVIHPGDDYVRLSERSQVRGRLRRPIERDERLEADHSISDCVEFARAHRSIIT